MFNALFSRPCSYAVRALTYLATQPAGKLTGKDEIAERESIPSAFLGKVLLSLCRDRVLRSRKGLRGGYELALPPEQISLRAVVRAVDGESLKECLLEDHECSNERPCAMHNSWCPMREQLQHYLEATTVADLARTRAGRSGAEAGQVPAEFGGRIRRESEGE